MAGSLRWRILLLTALAPLLLGAAALLTVHHDVTEHVDDSSLHENLDHSVAVFEGMLATRSRALAGGAQVVAEDPRFFSLLMLGGSQQDSRFARTVRLMANDFNRITQTDVFEVLDRRGRVLASAGEARSTAAARDSFVREALHGRVARGVLVEDQAHYQLVATPVRGDGRVVGVLLLGANIGSDLANELRHQMRCEVTFLNGARMTGTTLSDSTDREALAQELERLRLGAATSVKGLGVLRVGKGARQYLTLIRNIPDTPRREAQFYVLQRSFDPEVTFANTIRRDLLALAAVAVILALVGGWLLSSQILGPIHRLVHGAREMQAGNYDHPLDVRRGDELGYLAQQFADMRQRERAYVGSLEQATRLKSEFIHVASHELRTPISVISGYLDVLASMPAGAGTEQHAHMVAAMREHLARLTKVAESATQVAEVESKRIQLDIHEVSLHALLVNAIAQARAATAGRSVRIQSEIADPTESVAVDPVQLSQAITQLIENGVRFSPDGSLVVVRATVAKSGLEVAVIDHGEGLSAERVEQLRRAQVAVADSEPVAPHSGNERGPRGLGLGLPLARGIVEAHGGELRIVSEWGRGSTFTLWVPQADTGQLAA